MNDIEKLIDQFVKKAAEKNFYILDVQIRKDGVPAAEWSRFPAKPRFETYSVAKTFSGVGIGMALEEGIISFDERICDTFKEESYDVANENALSITVRDLLTMTAGLSETMMWRDGYERKHERDWVRYFYTHGKFENKPGTVFLYNNACPYMLGAMIQKKTGMNLCEYMRYRLFEPIGIHNPEWGTCPMGRTIAANALAINADEMGRFGQFLADGGVVNGKRLISEKYVRDMFKPFTKETGEFIPGQSPAPAGYGYQTWIDPVHQAGYMWGIFGQYCIVLPEKNAVVSVISLDINDGGSNGQYETSPVRALIWETMVSQI